MAASLVEDGYMKDKPMTVNKTTITEIVRENEELLGLRRGDHRINITYREYDPFSSTMQKP